MQNVLPASEVARGLTRKRPFTSRKGNAMKVMLSIACVMLFAASATAEVRTWKDKTGKFAIQAELMGSDGMSVRLKKADGSELKVPIERLSDEDRQFVETQEKNAFSDTAAATEMGPSADAPALRYGWKAGQQYLYKVKIEVDLGDETLEMTGMPSYSVRSADKDKIVLSFRGSLMEHTRSNGGRQSFGPRGPRGPGRMGPPPHARPSMHSPFSPMTGVGPFGMARETELTVDPLGNVARQDGTSQLPFLMGNLSQMMIEQFPVTSQQTWTVSQGSGVVIKEGGVPHFGPLASDEGFVPANEKTTYTIESANDKAVVIRKQYEFRAAAAGSDKPPFEISGDGKYTFNKQECVSSELDFAMKVTFRTGGLSVDVPVKATYHLIDEAEKAAMAKAAKEAEAEAKRPLAGNEISNLVAELKSSEQDRVTKAAQQLATKTPENPDAEIAKALEELVLNQQNDFVRVQAAKALEKWSTPANAAALIKALDDKNPMVRVSAVKALTKFKPQEAIEPISTKLGDLFTRGPGAEFLKAVGPSAEPAVLKLLEDKDAGVRKEAASILKTIGTKASVAALEKAANDPNVFVKNSAKEALEAVRGR